MTPIEQKAYELFPDPESAAYSGPIAYEIACNKVKKDRANFLAGAKAQEEVDDWVSVDERLPDSDGEYLCMVTITQECGSVWHKHRIIYMHMNQWQLTGLLSKVTHWKHLPKAPQQ